MPQEAEIQKEKDCDFSGQRPSSSRPAGPKSLLASSLNIFRCVPVIISDEYVLPYSHFIDWSLISIRWPEALIEQDGGPEELYDYLAEIPLEAVARFQLNLKEVYSSF